MTVPPRKVNGQCPECLRYDLWQAPRNCVRCAMQEADQMGYKAFNLSEMSAWDDDFYATLIRHYEAGWVRPAHFYVYVGYTRGRLNLPMEPLMSLDATGWDAAAGRYESAVVATMAAMRATYRYEAVWIVTKSGAWMIADTRSF